MAVRDIVFNYEKDYGRNNIFEDIGGKHVTVDEAEYVLLQALARDAKMLGYKGDFGMFFPYPDNRAKRYIRRPDHIDTTYLTKKVREVKELRRNISFDMARTIKLGGDFEQVGGNDDQVGGGNQKMGSDNQ